MVNLDDFDDSSILNIIKPQEATQSGPKSLLITPSPLYVLKLFNTDGKKIFLNITTHDKIPNPEPKTEEEMFILMNQVFSDADDQTMVDYRIPMSIGEPHMEVDNRSEMSTAYDVIVHEEFGKMTQSSEAHFQFFLHRKGNEKMLQNLKKILGL